MSKSNVTRKDQRCLGGKCGAGWGGRVVGWVKAQVLPGNREDLRRTQLSICSERSEAEPGCGRDFNVYVLIIHAPQQKRIGEPDLRNWREI